MVVNHFLKWVSTARVAERAAAAAALARAYVNKQLPFEDRCAAEAALTLLLDDPSSKVRAAMAEALAMSRHAPIQIVSALASDQPEVAAWVLSLSPLFSDADLIDRVASGDASVQSIVARRASVSRSLAAALAEVGDAKAGIELLGNSGASIAAMSFRRIAERHGHIASAREALLAHRALPTECRHMLLVKVGEALKGSSLVVALMGKARAERITRDACIKASVTLIDRTDADEHDALVEHLRLAGELTPSFVVRTVAYGKIDFFGAVLVSLTGQSRQRVTAMLAGAQNVALSALFRQAGLAPPTHAVILTALKIWRQVARGERVAGVQEVTWMMLRELGDKAIDGDLATLLKSIHVEELRQNARGHALAIAAA
ncbi:MAG: DUF2336 domain-containing protein [Rhizobiaceae bacterium]